MGIPYALDLKTALQVAIPRQQLLKVWKTKFVICAFLTAKNARTQLTVKSALTGTFWILEKLLEMFRSISVWTAVPVENLPCLVGNAKIASQIVLSARIPWLAKLANQTPTCSKTKRSACGRVSRPVPAATTWTLRTIAPSVSRNATHAPHSLCVPHASWAISCKGTRAGESAAMELERTARSATMAMMWVWTGAPPIARSKITLCASRALKSGWLSSLTYAAVILYWLYLNGQTIGVQ
jgi:hypothetical protein